MYRNTSSGKCFLNEAPIMVFYLCSPSASVHDDFKGSLSRIPKLCGFWFFQTYPIMPWHSKPLIGYSCGVLFIYCCFTTVCLGFGKSHFHHKSWKHWNFCNVFMPQSIISVNTNTSPYSFASNYHPQWFCLPPTSPPCLLINNSQCLQNSLISYTGSFLLVEESASK